MAKSKSSLAESLGLAALAAAAAATYYFSDKSRRKKAKAWTQSAKKDLMDKLMKARGVSQKVYAQASKEVLAKYKQLKNIDPKDVRDLAAELKSGWAKISKDLAKLGAKPKAKAKSKKS